MKIKKEKLTMMYAFDTEGHLLASDKTTPQDFFSALGNVSLQMMHVFANSVKPEEQEAAKGEIFDLYNQIASSVLNAFMPDNLHPNLTAQAILEAENTILDREVPTLQDQVKGLAKDIKAEMIKDGLITPVKQIGDNVIPLNRAERRSKKGAK